MWYAKVALALPIKGPFDYIVPGRLEAYIRPGSRVKVSFGKKFATGYVAGLSQKTSVSRLKEISALLDETPVLSAEMLALTKKLAEYYASSWGEMIQSAIPQGLRGRKKCVDFKELLQEKPAGQKRIVLVHSLSCEKRREYYYQQIKAALEANRGVILIQPDAQSAKKEKGRLLEKFDMDAALLLRGDPQELKNWLRLKTGETLLAVGTRSAVFAPVQNLGLIILEGEEDSVYKQEQAPHYHARQAAILRAGIENLTLFLGSSAPSLESFYLAKAKKIEYLFIPQDTAGSGVSIVDMRALGQFKSNIIFSKFLEDNISAVLASGGKALLFLNRRGFATFAACASCAKALSCPRCEIHLVYHFEQKQLFCHHCNFKMPLPEICPSCNTGYIRYFGMGTEKVESELSRIFPAARIRRIEKLPCNLEGGDIFISTSLVMKQQECLFELAGALVFDYALQRVDFRAAEKAYALLCGLLGVTKGKLIIQTHLAGHHVFSAIKDGDHNHFYDRELAQRRQAGFPPYSHLGLVKVRGKLQEKVKLQAERIFALLAEKKVKAVEVVSLNPSQPKKLRGNYYYQILLKSRSALTLAKFIEERVKPISRSNLTTTFDIDPL